MGGGGGGGFLALEGGGGGGFRAPPIDAVSAVDQLAFLDGALPNDEGDGDLSR